MDEKRKLGILLFNGPESQDLGTAIGLADAAIGRGLETEIFIMYEGVLGSASARLNELAKKGVKVTVCSNNTNEMKAIRSEAFVYGSQLENASLLPSAYRYIAFT